MANARARPAFEINEHPDLTVLILDTSGNPSAAQNNSVILKVHKSVLCRYEYFKQLLAAQPETEVLELPNCDVKIPVIVDVLEYLYGQCTQPIERRLARSCISYFAYYICLYQLSLRFYLPELEKIAVAALDREEIGIQDGSFEDMEILIMGLYRNRRGKKWKSLRRTVIKRQAWKLIKMPGTMLDMLDERFPGFQRELAEIWQLKLEDSGASRGSWLMCWRRAL